MANNRREFRPKEPYTHRLSKILEEYPDGSQILREILQNSDDAGSTEQIFILDHNTYPSNNLIPPDIVNSGLNLDRYQGPALLAQNNTIFDERDYKSLLKLADSEKYDQFNKIGVMGVGFNSIYHITDSPSFITGDKYVILDPHERYFRGGVIIDVDEKMFKEYPNQFAPFRIPCDKHFNGTLFRYPLRTEVDSADSEISTRIYKPDAILEMFDKFYENESINSLLFIKYIERISFYELKKGATELELLYKIQLEGADEVREKRRLIAKNIVPMMNSLKSGVLEGNNQLETSFILTFCRQKGDSKENKSLWLILNYLDDLLETEKYFQREYKRSIGDYKFVPNVGLAVPINDLMNAGSLFCFLPLPISTPFPVSVHGYFAVSTNRRSLWEAAENEDLAAGSLARLKVSWNHYLFEKVLPKAWVRFLRKIPLTIPNISPNDVYKFWSILKEGTSRSLSTFYKDLLQNVINNISIEDRVFKGPSSKIEIGTEFSATDDATQYQESEFHWLSLFDGYFEEENLFDIKLTRIIEKTGFPDKQFDELEGFEMIPLADVTLGTLTQHGNSYVYIYPKDHFDNHINDELNTFKNQLNKFIDKSIRYDLHKALCEYAQEWNLNIKILDEYAVVDMIKFSLNSENADSEEIPILDHYEWICDLWSNLRYRKWDLEKFENLHLIPTSRSTLRQLNTPKSVFSNQINDNILKSIFEKFGAVFVDSRFGEMDRWGRASQYTIKPDDVLSVLKSFRAETSYPKNLNHRLEPPEASQLVDYLSNHLRLANEDEVPNLIEVIKHLPIFTEVDNTSPISLLPGNTNWFLLPQNEESSYGKIIYPSNQGKFLDSSSQNLRYILENTIKIPRLVSLDYWRSYVMPFLESQPPEDKGIVIHRLFERLQSLLDHDPSLKDSLGGISFVPVGTFRMAWQRQTSFDMDLRLVKPKELFDPESLVFEQIFFEDEQAFPVNRFRISRNLFLSNLKSLGMKSILFPDDVINRINTIVARKSQGSFHTKAFDFFKYIDEKWELIENKNHEFMNTILNKEWIPTVDGSGNQIFSKPQDCYYKEYEYLVCLVAPILNYNVKNDNFLRHLRWQTYPEVRKVLEQLESCHVRVSSGQSPENLKAICNAIYEYMNNAFQNDKEAFEIIKNDLENKPWILHNDTFYSADKFVFRLPTEFEDNNSLIVELPIGYISDFRPLFEAMGVRNEIGVKELILIINNMVEGNEERRLSDDEINH
ncbi:13141_t:CDS:2 [Funneliformis mosseae]|uniref:13141_t:CDS:1 n=1 Tax=Funneliformis mosseae TaxID=27381 RepID=A0A9N9DAX2_FUNMO|nr:13141_t:CDS:2 [Funneliformis mosseae]